MIIFKIQTRFYKIFSFYLTTVVGRGLFVLVMCYMEPTHDSDPTPIIVSSIPTPAKWNR